MRLGMLDRSAFPYPGAITSMAAASRRVLGAPHRKWRGTHRVRFQFDRVDSRRGHRPRLPPDGPRERKLEPRDRTNACPRIGHPSPEVLGAITELSDQGERNCCRSAALKTKKRVESSHVTILADRGLATR